MTLLDHVPRYRRIEQALRERIAGLRPGDPLPSDSDLCDEFGVSRMTARNAMQRLAEEGLIVREPGRGSFVAQPPAHRRANLLMTFSREMERQGRVPGSRMLGRGTRPASMAEATALGLQPGEGVVWLIRLRCADDRPIALEKAVLHARCAPIVLAADLERGSLHEALARGGILLRRGTATIVAEVATPEDARLFGIAVGDPILVERRVILDAHGRRTEATESRYPSDRYGLDVWFEVEEPILEPDEPNHG